MKTTLLSAAGGLAGTHRKHINLQSPSLCGGVVAPRRNGCLTRFRRCRAR